MSSKWKISVEEFTLESERGTLHYGLRLGGYTGWMFSNRGVVVLPYAEVDNDILVGLRWEDRPNMGGLTPCAIGGTVTADKKRRAELGRIIAEKASPELCPNPEYLPELSGRPLAADRSYFQALEENDTGVTAYKLKVSPEQLSEKGYGTFLLKVSMEERGHGDIEMFPWKDAARECGDALAAAAILRLVAIHL